MLSENLIASIVEAVSHGNRNLSMPGNPRYASKELEPYFGYDQWVLWLSAIEISWLYYLMQIGYAKTSDVLTRPRVSALFNFMRTQDQDKIEERTRHDIIALIEYLLLDSD